MAANSIKRRFRDLFDEKKSILSDKSKAILNGFFDLNGKELYEYIKQLHKILINEKISVIENLIASKFCTQSEMDYVVANCAELEDIDIFNVILHCMNDSICKWPDFQDTDIDEKPLFNVIYDRISFDCNVRLQNLIESENITNQVVEFFCILYTQR